MSWMSRGTKLALIAGAMALLGPLGGCSDRTKEARAQVLRWTETLDGQTNEAGVYIRHEGEVLPESDPWGNPIQVGYKRGGMSETLTVRSLGPDGIAFTDDDVIETRSKVSLVGAGSGLKQNLGEVAEDAGKGFFRGAVQGLREGVRLDRERSDPALVEDADSVPDPDAL